MLTSTYLAVKTRFAGWARAIEAAIKELVKPVSAVPALAADAGGDMVRSRPELVAENALLRQQLIVLRRSVHTPRINDGDRLLMVLLAGLNSAWSQVWVLNIGPPRLYLRRTAPGAPWPTAI
jgi:hypothetical protein